MSSLFGISPCLKSALRQTIPEGKGFHLTFANGWTVSVQFGEGNYCENYMKARRGEHKMIVSKDAEIAAWDSNGQWHSFGGDIVKGRCDADEVAAFITLIAAMPPAGKADRLPLDPDR